MSVARLRFVILLLATTAACAHLPPRRTLPAGTFWDGEGHRLQDAEIGRRLSAARFVLVGEAHDNPCDHLAEAHIIQLQTAEGPVGVGLEMVAFDHQSDLDRFSSGTLDLKDLWTALDWKKSWGFPSNLYAPVFSAARAARKIVALNAPESLVHDVRDKGFAAATVSPSPSITPRLVPPPPAEEAFLKEAFEQHGKKARSPADAKDAWDRFLRVQSFWDSEMAWRAFRASEESRLPVVILAGGGHVEHGWGIASRLLTFAPGAKVLSILPWRGDDADRVGADLYYFCPETEERAPGAAR